MRTSFDLLRLFFIAGFSLFYTELCKIVNQPHLYQSHKIVRLLRKKKKKKQTFFRFALFQRSAQGSPL